MNHCIFISDIHGRIDRYEKLFDYVKAEKPVAVFIGGDILAHASLSYNGSDVPSDFILDYLIPGFQKLKEQLKNEYPEIFIILGNDDPKFEEEGVIKGDELGVWKYIHNRKVSFGDYSVYGYANVPPTPFQLKDWERYDVSRYVDPGCVHPTEGRRTVEENVDIEYATIQKDLKELTGEDNLDKTIMLFHTPPYKTNLDRAALDGKMIDHVPLDVHVGSIAVQRFIEEKQPLLTLHGHIHESSSITGEWRDKMQATHMYSAAYHKKELAIVKFTLENLDEAQRILL